MATYTGTMYVGGDQYSSTASGYQIAGSDGASAQATISLPDDYSSYESCHIDCTLYSATAPSSWRSGWYCYLEIYKNGSLYGSGAQQISRSAFGDGSGASSRTFAVTLTNGYFEAGDSVMIKFVGSDGGYVDSSNRCAYLTGATFTSADAVTEYTLKFSANGGSGGPGTQTGEAGSNGYARIYIPGTEPTRSGFTFLGWARTSSGSVAYEPGDYIDINKDTTLYAVWQQITYSITYDDNGADSGAAPTDSTAYTSGATATVAGNTGNMALEGYAFSGWNTAADGSGTAYAPGASLTITSAVTLYAVWVLDEQVYIYTGTAWSKGEPQIYNGTAWQSGELALYANNNWNT